jgi:protein-S-isoprenylcysteine O-methyltransferase Ste14
MARKPVLPPTYFFLAMILMIMVFFLLPPWGRIPFPWNLTGLVPLVLGSWLAVVTDAAFKKAGTTVKPFEESSALLTHGAYRFSRHPMYLGMTVALAGLALLLGTLPPLAVAAAYGILLDVRFVRDEECMLEARFGDSWREYRKRTRRWI